MTISSYKDLYIWQNSVNICVEIYKVTNTFPKEEIFNLTSQMRRCSISIASNIAEGYGRRSTKDYIRFLRISYGSLLELETQLLIAEKLGYIDGKHLLLDATEQLKKMTYTLVKKLEQTN